MNEALGERTEAAGFVPAPTIFDGRLVDSVGGGISQVATTLYNAAFFGGLELVAHTPHSLFIDRYPVGREATISWGGPELIFRNDWPAALLMKVAASDTAIAVTFYSSLLNRRVETTTSEPFDYVQPTVREVTNAALATRHAPHRPGGRRLRLLRRVHAPGLARRRAPPGRALHDPLPAQERDRRGRPEPQRRAVGGKKPGIRPVWISE